MCCCSIRLRKAASPRARRSTPENHRPNWRRTRRTLPQFLGRQDDIVLVKRKPSVEFLSRIKQAGFPLPEFVELDEAKTSAIKNPLKPQTRCSLRPWAWGPDSYELLRPAFTNVTGEKRADDAPLQCRIGGTVFQDLEREFLAENFALKNHGSARPRSWASPVDTQWRRHWRRSKKSGRWVITKSWSRRRSAWRLRQRDPTLRAGYPGNSTAAGWRMLVSTNAP